MKEIKQKIFIERRVIQKLIRDSEISLYRKIKKNHRKFIKLIGAFYDTEMGHLIDANFYEGVERRFVNQFYVKKRLNKLNKN